MLIEIDEEVLQQYPEVQIGYLVAEVTVTATDSFVEDLKKGLAERVQKEGILPTNYTIHPCISRWRKIYEEDFGVKAKTFPSSIEGLLKRVVKGKTIWNINSIVDLYNCCSVLTLLPMGGYDLNKIRGDIKIRFGNKEEVFLGLGEKQNISVRSDHIVYADQERIMCWLWNHKDSAETCIDDKTKTVLFFVDGFDHDAVLSALKLLAKNLKQIGCFPIRSGVMNRSSKTESLSCSSP